MDPRRTPEPKASHFPPRSFRIVRADLRIVPDAGHAMSEYDIVHELVAATRRFALVQVPAALPMKLNTTRRWCGLARCSIR